MRGAPADKTKFFISYSRGDGELLVVIVEALKGQSGLPCVRDTDDILPAEEWWARLAGLILVGLAITDLQSTALQAGLPGATSTLSVPRHRFCGEIGQAAAEPKFIAISVS